MRGGVSEWMYEPFTGKLSSPRAWGCFPHLVTPLAFNAVFPTCVGVFPQRKIDRARYISLPHVRGGVSRGVQERHGQALSSPRAWGCFERHKHLVDRGGVFPTCVGVFLTRPLAAKRCARLPHVRGGVSLISSHQPSRSWSSPRAWGCFHPFYQEQNHQPVFPTCVGVFPFRRWWWRRFVRLPHVRGGVSKIPCVLL